jgi:hypothetical protein
MWLHRLHNGVKPGEKRRRGKEIGQKIDASTARTRESRKIHVRDRGILGKVWAAILTHCAASKRLVRCTVARQLKYFSFIQRKKCRENENAGSPKQGKLDGARSQLLARTV